LVVYVVVIPEIIIDYLRLNNRRYQSLIIKYCLFIFN